ncbi:MAG TPA: zf-HC2 domain-containing protein [Actinomycetota bacterium]|nr:zf-HC2 domain-containing protein [Actinomycetota bacterium]
MLRQVERYLDGELDVLHVQELEVHVQGCSPCLDRLEFQRALKALIAEKCGCREVPAALFERIRRALPRHDPPATPIV